MIPYHNVAQSNYDPVFMSSLGHIFDYMKSWVAGMRLYSSLNDDPGRWLHCMRL
jgi:hypothetical protein